MKRPAERAERPSNRLGQVHPGPLMVFGSEELERMAQADSEPILQSLEQGAADRALDCAANNDLFQATHGLMKPPA